VVDSRQKGARAENAFKAVLNTHTNKSWLRVPSSGALSADHGLKGDLYFKPLEKNKYCIEVKHYKSDALTSKILSGKSNIETWWAQTIRESSQVNKEPLLAFKHDRSKWFIATLDKPKVVDYVYLSKLGIYIAMAEQWLVKEDISFEI